MTKERRYEGLFFSDEEKDDGEVLPVSESPLLVVKMVCVVEISDLSCLASGHNLVLTYEDMTDLQF